MPFPSTTLRVNFKLRVSGDTSTLPGRFLYVGHIPSRDSGQAPWQRGITPLPAPIGNKASFVGGGMCLHEWQG